MDTLSTFADALLSRLAWTSVQAVLLIAALWLIMRYVPRLSPAVRCMLWWLVSAQLVLGMTLSTPVQLHWLKPVEQKPFTVPHDVVMHISADTTAAIVAAQATAIPSPTSHWNGSWSEAVLLLWLSIILLQVIFAIRHWLEAQALLREARPATSTTLQSLCMQQARALGMRRIPVLRVSDAIVSPQVTGLWRPVVLMPAEQTLSQDELAMAIAHELAHIHRGDLWLGWIPALAQRLFFFHPLVNWAMREYAIYREAACDAQVLQRHDATPQHYGHLLVRLGVVNPVHSSLAGASSTFLHLKRRLIMLQQSVNDTTPGLRSWLLVAAIALVGVLPYRVTASDVTSQTHAAPVSIESIPATPAIPPAPPAPAVAATSSVPPIPPAPDAPPTPPAPPAALGFNASRTQIHTHDNATRSLLLYDGDTLIVDGKDSDVAAIERMHKSGSPLLWFRRNGRAYVSHDANLIREAQDAYVSFDVPTRGEQQLVAKQSELAAQESALVSRDSALAGREAELASRSVSLDSQRLALQSLPLQEKYIQEASLQGQQQGVRATQVEIDREHHVLSQATQNLAKQEAELAAREAIMSQQQIAGTRQANQQLDKLLDEAVARGLAKPADR
ncbi:M56 family metallopeptidase [Dyella nitratireducens]|uniref:Peptidase M56 domain-containing protein n=1 Tax=Dyella nitratireducens TaxID=1849580 RepID=A0ABQ1FTD4_9GAMM|nr:M56 family metallopeptidase [Dyella nitratireducens]GGA27079.1 hypothetical protein GCM10010981_14700 [Dyella nitratireducens]GLQ43465.1 hypothetical protein GCM10007902_33150 [Dyella nitratireducens]